MLRIYPSIWGAFLVAIVAVMVSPAYAGGHMAKGGGETASPEGAKVYIVSPGDGDTVTSPVTVAFGLKGMGVAPAGVEKAKTGHHHLLIDTPLPPLDEPIPADDKHVHFGGGQTEVTVDLPAGEHTFQLLLADHNHIPHSPPIYSEVITVTVKGGM